MRCLECGNALEGRVDKKFCDDQCRSAYHYQQSKNRKQTLFASIDRQLKLNRRLLKHFNRSGKSTIRATKLEEAGFNPAYFTHYWKNNRGQVYLFCYDVGFLAIAENGRRKFLLIDWQEYMTPKRAKHNPL
ncbi:MAG: DUF2116 family Zn-ribbon domain-containing protein [Flavobacteriales bacterium]|nr:DUF2116 family Zn-ribbon domain-containing protein [Flavobacteriales bacterium]